MSLDYTDLIWYVDTDFPDGTDQRNLCSSHIREAKQALVCSFSGMDAACEATGAELSHLTGLSAFMFQTGYLLSMLMSDESGPSSPAIEYGGTYLTQPQDWWDSDYSNPAGSYPSVYAAPARMMYRPSVYTWISSSYARIVMWEGVDSPTDTDDILIQDVCGNYVRGNQLNEAAFYDCVLISTNTSSVRTYRIKNLKL